MGVAKINFHTNNKSICVLLVLSLKTKNQENSHKDAIKHNKLPSQLIQSTKTSNQISSKCNYLSNNNKEDKLIVMKILIEIFLILLFIATLFSPLSARRQSFYKQASVLFVLGFSEYCSIS